jgi:hypothetical protein
VGQRCQGHDDARVDVALPKTCADCLLLLAVTPHRNSSCLLERQEVLSIADCGYALCPVFTSCCCFCCCCGAVIRLLLPCCFVQVVAVASCLTVSLC